MGIVETSGVTFTTFQMSGEDYKWWKACEEGSPTDAAPLTWALFSEMFMRKFVPQTLRDEFHTEFEQLRQGAISVSKYAIRFSELSRHAPALVATVRDRVRRFIERLNYALPATSNAMATSRFQVAHYAPPLSSAPPALGAFSGLSSRPGQSQFQQPHPPRACFECGNTRHMVRDYPTIRRGAPP
uniref:Retrotransposon gag domain-containing protein n=1 Tax=Nicotiana tabacum TaxID=4097 RepID=A0A1S3XIA0_TOBAC|nr:PREDICTED: uncharacterized protein LOC107765294 [Nicotiana tabacum]